MTMFAAKPLQIALILLLVSPLGASTQPFLTRIIAAVRRHLQQNAAFVQSFFPSLGLAFFCHFYRLSHFTLSIDDEFAAFRSSSDVWLVQGRWTTYWLERLCYSQPTLPFVTDALFCLTLTVAYICLLKAHNLPPNWKSYLAFPLFCASPVLMVLGEFYANLFASGAAYLLVGVALLCLRASFSAPHLRQKSAAYAAHIFCVAAAAGCYQSFLLLYAAAGFGMVLFDIASARTTTAAKAVRTTALICLSTLAGAIVYFLLQKLHLALLVASSDTVYVDHLFQLAALKTDFMRIAGAVVQRATQVYRGKLPLFGAELSGLALVFATCLAAVAATTKKAGRPLAGTFALVFSQLLLAPFYIDFFTGGSLPLRCYVAVPYVSWWLSSFALRQELASIRLVGATATFLAVFQLLVLQGQYSAQMDVVQTSDRAFAAQIYRALEQSRPDFSATTTYQLDVFGAKPSPRYAVYPSAPTSTTGASFFSWDDGNPLRMILFMNLLGYSNLDPVDQPTRQQLMATWATMPSWPSPGCIVWQKNTALIKLSANPGVYHHTP